MKHFVGKIEEFSNRKNKRVKVGRKNLLIWKKDHLFFATSEECPHQGASLSSVELTGTMVPSDPKKLSYGLEGCIIRCPWHAWEFNVETGRKMYVEDQRCLVTYKVLVENDNVYIKL